MEMNTRKRYMILADLWRFFQENVFTIPSTDTLFNQYHDSDVTVDVWNAHQIRQTNLKNYVSSFPTHPTIVIIGEAPGPWGCRFSGIPFTSEYQLVQHSLPFPGTQTSKNDKPFSSRSSTIFWGTMLPHHPTFFIWNCIPFHPHNRSTLLSVRNPTRLEVSKYSSLLQELFSTLSPRLVITIGRHAEYSLNKIGITNVYVRHPSRGGAKKFQEGMENLLS